MSEMSEDNFATDAKEKNFKRWKLNTTWYAACESGHAFWSGKDRADEDEAKADAKAHDDKRHGGTETASVLSY